MQKIWISPINMQNNKQSFVPKGPAEINVSQCNVLGSDHGGCLDFLNLAWSTMLDSIILPRVVMCTLSASCMSMALRRAVNLPQMALEGVPLSAKI